MRMPVESSQPRQESSPALTLAEQFSTAAASARNSNAVHDIITKVWGAYAEGLLDEHEAQRAVEQATARKAAIAERSRPNQPFTNPPPKKLHCKSPDRERSNQRARRLAASRDVPDTIRQHYPTGENAALAIIAFEIRQRQVCTLPNDQIAARAGVSRSTVQRALRQSQRLGHLSIKERRIPGRKNDTNIVRIISLEWNAYLHWQTIGCQKRSTTETPLKTRSASLTKEAPKAPSITLEKPFGELTRQERADLLRRMIGKSVA